jgi:hypothetical protein
MRIFDFDPADYREAYDTNGWVHIRGGINSDFLELLREFAQSSLEDTRLDAFAIKGKKEQSIFDFPPDVDYPNELYEVVSATCGLDRDLITLSERHIQAYEPEANPEPAAHKDRVGSQVSVGLSIDIPAESRLVLYPFDHRDVNPFNSSAAFRKVLGNEGLPEVVLKNAREVELADQAGDVVMFPGSTTWHLRRHAANAVNLYLKFNDFHCDPLGEDPHTPDLGARTRDLVAGSNGDLGSLVPTLGRRLDSLTREYTRNGWQEIVWARIWGEDPFPISEAQFRLARAVDGERNWKSVVAAAATDGESPATLEAALVELANLDVIDLKEGV